MTKTLMSFWRDEQGATAIEYALIASLIAVGLIVALLALQGNLRSTYTSISNRLLSLI